jgi:carboxypeptidase family protein
MRHGGSLRAVLVLATAVSAACGHDSSPTPSAPTPPPPAVALQMSAAPSLNIPGDAFVLTLTATDNRGTSDVTAAGEWHSSDLTVAQVQNGRVGALAAGTAQISATYLGRTATTTVAVTPLGTVRGVVHELPPTEQRLIAGATVTVVGGRFGDRQTRTDAQGAFAIGDVAGRLTIRIEHPAFDATQITVDASSATPLDVAMAPPAVAQTEVFAFASDPAHPTDRVVDTFPLSIHRSGDVRLALESWHTPYQDDGGDYLAVELLKGTAVLARIRNCDGWAFAAGAPCNGSSLPQAMDVAVEGRETYQLRISSERQIITAYRVLVTHPR